MESTVIHLENRCDVRSSSKFPTQSKNTNNHNSGGKQNIPGMHFCFLKQNNRIPPIEKKTHQHSLLQVPTTQLAKMSVDPKFVELTADVLEMFL